MLVIFQFFAQLSLLFDPDLVYKLVDLAKISLSIIVKLIKYLEISQMFAHKKCFGFA